MEEIYFHCFVSAFSFKFFAFLFLFIIIFAFLFIVLPKIIPFYFDNPMHSGESSQVTCSVSSGDQPLDITWSFEGRNVSALPGITASKVGRKASVLLIDPIEAIHRGNYSCSVRNPAGVVNFTAVLRINGMLGFDG